MTVQMTGDVATRLRLAGIEVLKEGVGAHGAEVQCRCPDHEDRTGHLYVNAQTGAAYCQKCHRATGVDALCGSRSPGPFQIDPGRQAILEATTRFYEAHMGDEARRYLSQRRLPGELLRRFRVGWACGGLRKHLLDECEFTAESCLSAGVLADKGGRLKDFLWRRIVFPHLIGGHVVSLTGRAIDERKPKYLHLAGPRPAPYNVDALRDARPFLVEGIVDVLALAAWGLSAAALLG